MAGTDAPQTIFIAHDRRDAALARALAEAITAVGGTPWLDAIDLQPGDVRADGILEGLRGAGLVAVLITRSWTDGKGWYAPEQVDRAIDHMRRFGGGRVVPLLYGGVSDDALPYGLFRVQPLPVPPDGWRDAAATLARLVGQREVVIEAAPNAVPPEHIEPLRRWLTDIASRFDDVPSLLPGGPARRLSTLYVRLDQRAIDAAERHRLSQERIASGAQTLDALIRRAPGKRWTLQGDPGAGKTTYLRHLAMDRAEEALTELDAGGLGPARIPIFAPLAVLDLDDTRPIDVAVADHRAHAALPADKDALMAALSWAVAAGRALLLLDGFDEIRPASVEAVRQRIVSVAGASGDSTVVVSSRRFGYERPNDAFIELELLPLDRARKATLLKHWGMPAARIAEVMAQLAARPALEDMAGNPFVLTLMALLALETPTDQRVSLPTRRVALYQRVLDLLIAGRLNAQAIGSAAGRTGRVQLADVDTAILREGLAELALSLLQDHAGPWRRDELEAHQSRVRPLAKLMGRVECLSDALAADTGLLVAMDGARQTWRWRHRSLLECLAAEAIDGRGPKGPQSFAVRLAGGRWYKPWTWGEKAEVGRWAEVYCHLAGMRQSAEAAVAFLDAIRPHHPELAVRALLGLDELPIDRLFIELGESEPLAVVRRLVTVVDIRDERVRILLRIVRDDGAADALRQLAAAALLAEDAVHGLKTVVADPAMARRLGVPAEPWVRVPAGEFMMGDCQEPQRRHWVRGFEMGATPVTQALYAIVTGENPSHYDVDWRRPVETVSWGDAVHFCEALAAVQERDVRLPTEAEWEYACRAGTVTGFWSGDYESALDAVGWYHRNSHCTQNVLLKPANPWGIYDLHGNVWEWCLDSPDRHWLSPVGALQAPLVNPTFGPERVLRGGSWYSPPHGCRSASRNGRPAKYKGHAVGFRLVRVSALE